MPSAHANVKSRTPSGDEPRPIRPQKNDDAAPALSSPPPTQQKPKASCQASASANSLQGHHHTCLSRTFRLAEAASVGPLSLLRWRWSELSAATAFEKFYRRTKASEHTGPTLLHSASTLSVQLPRAGPVTHSALCLHPFPTHRSALAFFSEGLLRHHPTQKGEDLRWHACAFVPWFFDACFHGHCVCEACPTGCETEPLQGSSVWNTWVCGCRALVCIRVHSMPWPLPQPLTALVPAETTFVCVGRGAFAPASGKTWGACRHCGVCASSSLPPFETRAPVIQ